MKTTLAIFLGGIAFAMTANAQQTFSSMKAPEANQQPTVLEKHNHKRVDPYFWMNKRDSKEVLDYIAAENAYSKAYYDELKPLTNSLMQEFEKRIDPNERGPLFSMGGVSYYWKNVEGKDYRELYYSETGNPDKIFFDENERAAGKSYYGLGDLETSPDNSILGVSEDVVGRRKYTIRFRNNKTKKYLKDELTNTDGSFVWGNDNKTVFYVKKDETTLREFQVYSHIIGTSQSKDKLVYEEKDERFSVFLSKTFDKAHIQIYCQSSTTTEMRMIDANKPASEAKLFWKREQGHIYWVNHHENGFYILSNHEAPNRKLLHATTLPESVASCNTLIAHNSETYLEEFTAFKGHLVVLQRTHGKTAFYYGDVMSKKMQELKVDEEVSEISFGNNDDYNSNYLFFNYTSLTTPSSVFRYDLNSGERMLQYQRTILGGFNSADYTSERIWVTANDGTKIPVSLVYKKGIDRSKAPLLLYGYGSYGVTIPTTFSAYRISLLNRGFVFAIAHIRGGKFMGESWYEDGKLQHKRHSFTDFINCAEWLSMKGYCNPEAIYAQGGSAGGLLMGAVTNMAPHLFKGVIAQVPFVDVVTTMLDESIPLTVGEYEEWGNPNEAESYWYMLSYSPYDQVRKTAYPAMLITTGYHDSQVQYWEPLKWIAKLRDYNTGTQPLLLDCSMDAGHGGGSGRTTERMEYAKEFAFLLHNEGIGQ